MSQVSLHNVMKLFGSVRAVDDVSLTINDTEFVTLLGPSGCGKSTTLNLVAGLEEITSGEIYIGDRLVNDLDPKDRDIAMVFQNYALYPHKTVYGNLAFPLRMRGMAKDEIDRKVREAAGILGIRDLLERRPKELSGGQQQRVALGRALVRNPKVFLMDEPLSNLDAKLRVHMRAELKRLHEELRTTVIYVTHDQLEAMTLSDRVAIMANGKLQQFGTPHEVFEQPTNMFVAGFIGSPAMNFIVCDLVEENGQLFIKNPYLTLPVPSRKLASVKAASPRAGVVLGARHRDVTIHQRQMPATMAAKIYTLEPTGDITYVHVSVANETLVLSAEPSFTAHIDDPVWLEFNLDSIHLFDAQTQRAL